MAYSARNSAPAEKAVRAIVPTIPYRDALAMAEWLCAAYGFEKRAVTSANDELRYAQLAFGDHVVMVVRAQESNLERLVVHPDQIGGAETQACYLVVSDIEAHYARAIANGAEIVFGIEGPEGGDRRYASRDREGHIWLFGTYNPYQGRYPAKSSYQRHSRGSWPRAPLVALACALSIATIAAGVWTYADRLAGLRADALWFVAAERSAPEGAEVDARRIGNELQQVRAAKESAERSLSQTRAALEAATRAEKLARDTLAREMRARDGFARTATLTEDQLRQERTARSAAERAVRDATEQLGRAQVAKGMAERFSKELTEKWELERKARALAEQSAQSATAELVRERSAKAAAELAAAELRNQIAAIGTPPQGIQALRDQFEAERRARERLEHAAKDARLQLVQEKFSRDATERALKQVQDRLEQTQDRLAAASCWACPSGAPCAKP
jgi:uncharacterized glyoxalase superfamily protein PhnB